LGISPKRRIAIIDEAPQSIRKLRAPASTKMQVCIGPPLPTTSPLPRNRTRTAGSGRSNRAHHQVGDLDVGGWEFVLGTRGQHDPVTVRGASRAVAAPMPIEAPVIRNTGPAFGIGDDASR
jgi:hypothetical protein